MATPLPSSSEELKTSASTLLGGADTEPYAPRRSTRINTDLAMADGDTWKEKISVCEGVNPDGTPKLLIRSYYKNTRTGQKVWDEPPSGASNILFASAEDRKIAEAHMDEMKTTLALIPPEDKPYHSNDPSNNKKDKKGGFFQRLRSNNQKSKQVDDSQDLNLQRALARSMKDRPGRRSEARVDEDDDDDLAMAKALSLSVDQHTPSQMTEEEMIQQAIEESKREAEMMRTCASRAWTKHSQAGTGDLLGFTGDDYSDRKMPALKKPPTNQSNASAVSNTSSLTDPFDPYGSSNQALPPGSDSDLLSTESSSKPSSKSRFRMFGGGRKAMEDDAGLV